MAIESTTDPVEPDEEPLPPESQGDDGPIDEPPARDAEYTDEEKQLEAILAKASKSVGRGDPDEDDAEKPIIPADGLNEPEEPEPAPEGGEAGSVRSPYPATPGADSGAGDQDVEPGPPPTASEYIEINGVKYSKAEEQQLHDLIQFAIYEVNQRSQAQAAPPAPAAPQEPAAPATPAFDPEAFVDPDLARALKAQLDAQAEVFNPIQQQLAQLLQNQELQQQAAQQQLQIEARAAGQRALESTAEKFSLSEEEQGRLQSLTVDSGFIPVMADKIGNGSNPEAVFAAAMEATYWNTPELRDRNIAQLVNERVADQVTSTKTSSRKAKASGLAGVGGAVTRHAAVKPDPNLSPLEAQRKAIADAFREADRDVV